LRLLIEELRVNCRAEIVPTYRVVAPEVCAMSEKVERNGIEPVTSGLQSWNGPFRPFRSASADSANPFIHAGLRRFARRAPEARGRAFALVSLADH
jgi:hypothetical protein